MGKETLEVLLDKIRASHEEINELLTYKEITNHYSPEVKGLIKLYKPNLERECVGAIIMVTNLTEKNGHSPEYDYIKDTVFEVLGKCRGEEL